MLVYQRVQEIFLNPSVQHRFPGTVLLNLAAFSIPAPEAKMKVSQLFLSTLRHSNMALSRIANKLAYSQ